jgi:hypothetical protein
MGTSVSAHLEVLHLRLRLRAVRLRAVSRTSVLISVRVHGGPSFGTPPARGKRCVADMIGYPPWTPLLSSTGQPER